MIRGRTGLSNLGKTLFSASSNNSINVSKRISSLSLRGGFASSQQQQWTSAKGFSTATEKKPFDKILIANRGEIACRVINTCRRMGIKTVAIYSEADARALHVRMADEAVCVGPAQSLHSYLNVPKILEVIKETGAQAVHPGYGFLSENNEFSQAVQDIGCAFIGPNPYAIEAMGDKITSKQIAIDAGVNTIPGYQGILKDADEAVKVANEVGYPVMIKASAGGGGKGMRIAYDDEEARMGFRLSRDEAMSSFDDDRLFVEKFIEEPHHIEFQLVADGHGNVAVLPERECSIQRRNQKVVEEAPSAFMTPEVRAEMAKQAEMLAKAVDYRSAGTIEYLVDKNRDFYFLEMNTRLQVEHPITEKITSVDLVEQMLRVAAGYKLPDELCQGVVPFKGWAIESRVYAEDPLRGFLPCIGPLDKYIEPEIPEELVNGTEQIRCDSGIFDGGEISMYYDPMISKLISYGETRDQAIETMKYALDNYVIQGVGHNICFLQEIMRHPKFLDGYYTTKFVEEEYPDGFNGVELTAAEKNKTMVIASIIHKLREENRYLIDGKMEEDLYAIVDDVVVKIGKGDDAEAFLIRFQEGKTDVLVVPKDGSKPVDVQAGEIYMEPGNPIINAIIDGEETTMQLLNKKGCSYSLFANGAYIDLTLYSPREYELSKYMLEPEEIDYSKYLLSPMPGQLISIAVEEGQEVEIGQELAVIEAMKMQNVLRAEAKGVVSQIPCKVGDALKVDAVIVEFE